jgi:hypothetical protein
METRQAAGKDTSLFYKEKIPGVTFFSQADFEKGA